MWGEKAFDEPAMTPGVLHAADRSCAGPTGTPPGQRGVRPKRFGHHPSMRRETDAVFPCPWIVPVLGQRTSTPVRRVETPRKTRRIQHCLRDEQAGRERELKRVTGLTTSAATVIIRQGRPACGPTPGPTAIRPEISQWLHRPSVRLHRVASSTGVQEFSRRAVNH